MAVLIAGSLLGVVGAILAVPFAAVIKTVIREASAPRRARMEALRAAEPREEVPVYPAAAGHAGPLTAPAARNAATSSMPQSRRTASVSAPGSAGGPRDRRRRAG